VAVMSIRIEKNKQKLLKILSSLEGKTIGGFVENLIEDYMKRNKTKYRKELENLGLESTEELTESSLMEWYNKADDIYDEL